MVQRMISGLCTLYLDNSWSIPLLVQDAFTEITLQKIKIWKFSIDLNFQSVNFPTSWFPHWKLRHFRGEPPMKNPWISRVILSPWVPWLPPRANNKDAWPSTSQEKQLISCWFHGDFMVIFNHQKLCLKQHGDFHGFSNNSWWFNLRKMEKFNHVFQQQLCDFHDDFLGSNWGCHQQK